MKQSTLTVDTSAGLQVGNRLRNAMTGKIIVVTAISGECLTFRPLRWWESAWAQRAALWASCGAVLGWLSWLIGGALW